MNAQLDWHIAIVAKMTAALGFGYHAGMQVYVRKGHADNTWTVYDNGYGIRTLTTAECKIALKTTRKNGLLVVAANSASVSRRLEWEIWR